MDPSGSRQGSRAGSTGGSPSRRSGTSAHPAGSASHSRRPSQSGGAQFPPALGYDPAKPQGVAPESRLNTRLDLPPEAYMSPELLKNAGKQPFAKRPGYNQSGHPVNLQVNQFRAKKWDDRKKIYQYDVSVSPVHPKAAVIFKKCWEHPDFKNALAKYRAPWLHDGRRLAWSTAAIDRKELRVLIDLDKGKENPPRRNGKIIDNKFYMTIRETTTIDLSVLEAYLANKCDWNNKVLDSINFLDHLVRQGPSERLLSIRRNFYQPPQNPNDVFRLNPYVDLIKGVYASVRMNSAPGGGAGGLGLNVDVANTAFWRGGMSLTELIVQFLWVTEPACKGKSATQLAHMMRPERKNFDGGKSYWVQSSVFKQLRKLQKLRFTVSHRGKENNDKEYILTNFEFAEKYGADGANANTFMIPDKDDPEKSMSMREYFMKKYAYRITTPELPVVFTTRAGCFPPDACVIKPMQRYPYKLDPDGTAQMIKGAVTRPDQRRDEIMRSKQTLGLEMDRYLGHFGLQFDTEMARTQGRVLEPPKVQYANGLAEPKLTGRWDLRNKRFLQPGKSLDSWGVMILERACRKETAAQFGAQFKRSFVGHGCSVGSDPVIIDSQMSNPNIADAIARGIQEVKQRTKKDIDIMFCIFRFNNSNNYQRLKKSADCRFGVLTQVVLSKHVEKNQPQYHSNVAMKVNAKLGGINSRAPAQDPRNPRNKFFQGPTAIIGADVSHAVPGIDAPSVAAMTMSRDRDACKYAAAVQSNGYRVEMITPINTSQFLSKLVPYWMEGTNCKVAPQHIIYMRDGVSEGQFAQVLAVEVEEMKRFFKTKFNNAMPKFTVIVCTKRHHIRFFPKRGEGDRNNNTHPGTLVEKEVCHPHQFDFYLSSHSAIQGTARPTHYTVLMDEAKMPLQTLQEMIYQHCYQYARSTTPVSLHPAVYYADLACYRAAAHENVPTSDGFRTGPKAAEMVRDYAQYGAGSASSTDRRGTEAPPLLPMGTSQDASDQNKMQFNKFMWFV